MMNAEELRNTNCQKILQQTQKDLRALLYRASKLVTCENLHGLLEKSEKYDIIEGTNEFVKVPIKYKKPPVVLSFEYGHEMTKKNDLLVCISRKHKQPTHELCEKSISKPKCFDLNMADAEFSHPFLYVGLYSESGCSFTIRVSFPNDKSK
jgi:hypothetical protein